MSATPRPHPHTHAGRRAASGLYLVDGQGETSGDLTRAEYRLLPLLAANLTLNEIAVELDAPRHAIKAQAISIYRKLGISSGT